MNELGANVVNDVARHYEELLAEHYTWMFGVTFDEKVAEQRALLETLGVTAGRHGTALDLGSGPGFQAHALAQLGYARVVATDTSWLLLEELRGRIGALPIETVCSDLCDFMRLASPGAADAVVCMGDTLTHLQSRIEVSRLFGDVHAALKPGGFFVLTFRDLSIALTGLDRIIPVRADNDRIMTCVLDYEHDSVVVNDIVHVRNGEDWSLRKSSYRKLRIAPDAVVEELSSLGFEIRQSLPVGRMHAIVARI